VVVQEAGRQVQSLAVLAVPVLLICLGAALLMATRRGTVAGNSKTKDQ
jgi:GMP synthase-like glutamine amidotransferase